MKRVLWLEEFGPSAPAPKLAGELLGLPAGQ